jgi:uncharacterized damage-inducible protein DinB
MSEIERIVEQLRQVHEGEAWHGPSVREAVAGVTAEGAARRPVASAHSIRELVHHVRVTDEMVRAHVAGEDAAALPAWPAEGADDEAAWRRAVRELAATQQALREAVARFPEERLHEQVPGNGHSYWYELIGILQHDLYHAGQIALLKKAVA